MKPVLAVAALLLSACASAPPAPATPGSEALVRTDFLELPEDARRVAEKLAACNHFAGEFSGDKSTRDREVTAALTQLGCETIDEDVRLVLAKYPGDARLVKALKTATDLP